MARIPFLAIIAIIAAPVFGEPDLVHVDNPAVLSHYDGKIERFTPLMRGTHRIGRPIWSAVEITGDYILLPSDVCVLDWGDIAGGSVVGGLGFSYITNSRALDGDNTMVVAVYQDDNGWNSEHRQLLASYELQNLPGALGHVEYCGYIIRFELPESFVIDGDDLDDDGLADFSYVHWPKRIATPGASMGPFIAGTDDPNVLPPTCPGVENYYDVFDDPNFALDPNMNLNLPGGPAYRGTYWFGSHSFAQFYWEMFAPACTEPGDSGRFCAGDLGGESCVVDLTDLAILLANFGTGTTYGEGDIEPPDEIWPGDGDVDLADLAEMLAQYGDDCR